jgi:5-methylcytosine-specific restriction enzyme A
MSLRDKFHNAMLDIYKTARKERIHDAKLFAQMLSTDHGVNVAKKLISSDKPSTGFTALWEKGRLDLTVEALVIRDEFRELFTDEEREKARNRLIDYRYSFPETSTQSEDDNDVNKHSWTRKSDHVIVKTLDKSAFIHGMTGIPVDIRDFFGATNMQKGEKREVILVHNGTEYSARIEMGIQDSPRTRLSWKTDFSELIRETFPNFNELVQDNIESSSEAPRIELARISYDRYAVSLLGTVKEPVNITEVLIVGKEYRRRDLHDMFGGQRYGGISTPSQYPFIMIFTGDRGEEYGYKDGWTEDGLFLYTGEGQEGDMQFIKGNKAILEHEKDGKDIHLFEYVRTGYVKYVGQMLCVGYRLRDKDNKGQDRKVIVFELMPIEAVDNGGQASATVSSDLTLEELRKKALSGSNNRPGMTAKERVVMYRERSQAVKLYALKRANGVCEACGNEAPFKTSKGEPFLEVHHLRRLSDGGPDHPEWVAAICPNCHRRAHHSFDAYDFNQSLVIQIRNKESALIRID